MERFENARTVRGQMEEKSEGCNSAAVILLSAHGSVYVQKTMPADRSD